jgi:hypothetical protein
VRKSSAPQSPASEELAAADTEVAAPAQRDGLAVDGLNPGTSIDRFTIIGSLGRGGMGTVVSAYDPRLEREVAIKLVSQGSGSGGDDSRERLVREARALAKLRHPNVVAVYEVGEHQGQVYLAMEKVAGGDLRQALRALHRDGNATWRRILDRFISAGRGLAAAHAGGMVHRDFKPENVLVDDDSRVLVADFGLVGTTGETSELEPADGSTVHDRLTRRDVIMGTPAYMAPEQHLGMPVDARADQFAFCVALYEALYGELPFAGETRKQYVGAMTRGELRAPRPVRKVPRWLRDILARGLSPDPAARYASMDALLAELGADPIRQLRLGRRERTLATGGGVAVVAAWGGAMFGLDVELTYAALYASNLGFLILMILGAFAGRRVFARTSFNRKVISISIGIGATLLVLAAGGHLLAIPPDALGILHLVVIGGFMLTTAITVDPRLGVSAAVYFAGFLAAAARQEMFLAIVLVGHIIVGMNLFIILGARGRQH